MIKYYVLLFVRNLRRQKLFSFINLLGLSVSIASTLLIYLYVRHEFTYDSFHPDTDRLYRVNQTFIWAENPEAQFSRTGPGVAIAMKEELPEVEMVTSLHTPGNFIISYTTPTNEVVAFEETKVLAADTNFFKVLGFPLIQGDQVSAFRQANTLMMTRSTARKYFGTANPVGKMVRLGTPNSDKQETYEVTGVIENTPENSTIQFEVLLSMKSFSQVERFHWSWVWTQLETFVRLHPNAKIEDVREKLKLIPQKRADQTLRTAMNTTYDEYIKSGKKWDLYLQPITSLHLPEEPVVGSFPDAGNVKIIYSLIGAAAFIVLLSCINFMNLSTAQFTRRVKEASVRKILGMGKIHLSINYFVEALAFCMISLLTALAFTQTLLPAFNMVTGKTLKFNFFGDITLILAVVALTLFMAMVSASYPALFLSRFNPVEALKGKLKTGNSGKAFRNGLVVFQFSVSVILIICTAIVFEQLNYVSQKDLGFDKENLIQLKHAEGAKNIESLAKAALNIPGAVNAAWCSSAPPAVFGGDTFTAEGMNGQNFSLNYTSGDERFIPTLGIKMKLGRNFTPDNAADVNGIILNEAAVKRLGWKLDESIIGKKITYPHSEAGVFHVIGVVSDFNYWSLAAAIEPMGIFHIKNKEIFDGPTDYIIVRVQGQSAEAWQNTIAGLKTVWEQHAGDTPFEYGFIDEYFEATFKTQERFGTVLTVMAFLAIMIACLGLLGMIIYAIEQRTKEIGIRKVSGASVWNILVLISKGYTKLITIAFVIGAPISYWMMKQWLADFAYRITPSPWIFITTGIAILIVAILITSYHSVKAALINPVDVLKDE